MNTYIYVAANPLYWVDMYGQDWFRPDGHPYTVGRAGSIVEPGIDVNGNRNFGSYIDDYVPAGHTFGSIHDNFVDEMTRMGAPDWLVNIPTMPAAYAVAVTNELVNSIAGLFGYDGYSHTLEDDIGNVCR